MDMQNVSNLQIPEGVVRTIHDKDSRLIWGRLAYDTKYAGDTYQQTYSGKNLFDGEYVQYAVGGSLNNIWFSNASTRSAVVKCQPNTMYTITKFDPSNRFVVADYPSVPPSNTQINTLFINNTATTLTVTTNSDAEYLFIYVSGQNEEPRMQVELGSSPTSYEPYVGGIPAPNPDYPQPIQVVTGEQTVTIGDGVDSEDFTISLGSTELCKLGNYQDYIYKSGDDWYVHKAIYKYTFTGEEPWQLRNTIADGASTFSWNFVDMPVYAHVDAAVNASKCSYLNNHGRVTNINQMYYNFIGFAFYNKADAPNLSSFYANTNDADLATFKSGVTGELLYYPLATATDTQITDVTLVGQLNAVHEWLTRYGYSSTATGNLPLIVDRTNL